MASAMSRPSSAAKAHLDGVACHKGRLRLLAEDLDQPPLVSDFPGQTARLREVGLGRVGVVDGGASVGGECPGQEGGIV